MKFKATKKDFKDKKVLKVVNGKLQYLLSYENPVAYTSGIYGWYSDIYDLDGLYISTGYTPFGSIELNSTIIKKYNDKAFIIAYNNNYSYDQKKAKLDKLIQDFKKHVLSTI